MSGAGTPEGRLPEGRLLEGRVALVIGGSRGIGAGVARAFGRHGAAVGVNYLRSADAAKEVVSDIEAGGSRAVAVAGDAADAGDVAEIVRQTADALGDIDVLVCNAVGSTENAIDRVRKGLTLALDNAEDVQARVATQLATTLFPAREVLPGMRRRGGGSIVLIGATASRGRPGRGIAEISVAKAAQDALARSLAVELGPDRVRVNVVAPGMVPTDANAGPHQEPMMGEMAKVTPLGRVAYVDDVADTVVAFASGLTRHVTGAYVGVDGGRSML
ncbi:SDR family oxidoreductase [Actinomadura graeca]|uniref:SDR family oxidoreductase n=1 Tax=Actinomadura graeca TaxID=2750812 RepID=A0ABX8QYH1_9ACTN|nr:SDR family oxidoreductase [Actinomadura graeca]QXJ23886.1 SDR family oxidoreductase [Actinomadura graeca]